MNFLNPFLLLALLTVAIPLLIYLLNIRKPKKIRFSTLAFFESLRSTALKRLRYKRWLLLALRCLAIIMLVLAAARPVLPPGFGWTSGGEPKIIGILVDNSPTMSRVDRSGPYIEQALDLAKELIAMASSEDRILINVTNGESYSTAPLSPRGASGRLSDIKTVNSGNYLVSRLFDMRDRLREAREPNKIIYLITDGQQTQFPSPADMPVDESSPVNIQIIQLGTSESANTGFESVTLETGGIENAVNLQLRVILKNFGNRQAQNQFLSLFLDDDMISQQPVSIDPGGTSEYLFNLPNTNRIHIPAMLVIEGDELIFDNHFFAAIRLPEKRNLLVLEESGPAKSFNSYLRPMLEVMGEENIRFEITFRTANNFQPGELSLFDAVILDGLRSVPDYLAQAVTDHVQSGNGLLFLPAADGNMTSYNRLLAMSGAGRYANLSGSYGSFEVIDRMAAPVEGHPVFDTLFEKQDEEEIRINIPELFYFYQIETRQSSTTLPILTSRTGWPLLAETRVGNGRFIYSAIGSDPGWSNLPVKPIFAPLFFRTIDYLAGGEGAVINSHTLGKPFTTLLNYNPSEVSIKQGNEQIIPELRQTFQGTEIAYEATEWVPGWFLLETDRDTVLFSSNQDAMESRLASLDKPGFEVLFRTCFKNVQHFQVGSGRAEILSDLQTASFGREIWYWFISIAIIFLLIESILSRYYKAETIT